MKLKRIKSIKDYKSYTDFSWLKYFNSQELHESMNIFFGENGCGKSSITNILKSVCDEKKFEKHKPSEIILQCSDGDKKYSSTSDWDAHVPKGTVLFFDRDFVDQNIHLGHKRGTTATEQEQQSGKLIIEFDNEAIKLRNKRDQEKTFRDDIQKKINEFRENNNDELDFVLSDEEKKLYRKFSKYSKEEIGLHKKTLENDKSKINNLISRDKVNQDKILEIQNIQELEVIATELLLSDLQSYKDVFEYPIKEKSLIDSEQTLIDLIKTNKEFFHQGIQIRDTSSRKCPFCQSESEEEKIKSIIKTYNTIYDDSYKISLERFNVLKEKLITELELIESTIKTLQVSDIFLKLKALDEKFKLESIYSVEEEKFYKRPLTKKMFALKQQLSAIEKPSFKNIENEYNEALDEYNGLQKYIDKIKSLIETKNGLIRIFKLENTDIKITARIAENSEKSQTIQNQIDFFNDNKIEKKKKSDKKLNDLKKIKLELINCKDNYKLVKDQYEEYASSTAFSNLLTKIQSYFASFNFNFTLKLETENRKTGATKEFPFAFKILDTEKNERDLKEGLSEGELQVLSLCFFFAFLDIQNDKSNKILLFDDPISSLDNSNLSCLVELICEKHIDFSQTFILTHHRTFFKFLQKKFKTSKKDKKGSEFLILRNQKEFGGSFILPSIKKDLTKKLKWFADHTVIESETQNGLDIETKIIEYGQYLRYETERFVKNTLLQWNEDQFPKLIEGIKGNRLINDEKLEALKKVYSFCNWTTSHVDVGDDHGVSQLKSHIQLFLSVKDD